jgi:hypothetical protein
MEKSAALPFLAHHSKALQYLVMLSHPLKGTHTPFMSQGLKILL